MSQPETGNDSSLQVGRSRRWLDFADQRAVKNRTVLCDARVTKEDDEVVERYLMVVHKLRRQGSLGVLGSGGCQNIQCITYIQAPAYTNSPAEDSLTPAGARAHQDAPPRAS
jgi:hypothetical protein